MTTYIGVRIEDSLADSLTALTKKFERSKNYLVRMAIENFIYEQENDEIDDVDIALAEIALQRMNDPHEQLCTSEDMRDFIRANCRD